MEKKFICEPCNFSCKYNCEYIKHVESEKHKRLGKKKDYKCESCDYITTISHWNLKMHVLVKHATKEERAKMKYYCSDCDQVCFSQLYFDTHKKSKIHINNALVKEYDNSSLKDEINEMNLNTNIMSCFNELLKEIKLEIKNELLEELKNL
jgi:hypothetical protein